MTEIYAAPAYQAVSALADLSGAELRLELAEAEATKPTSICGSVRKKNRIKAITAALVERGCF